MSAVRPLIITPFGRRLGGSDNILLSVLRTIDRERLEPTVVLLEPGPFRDEIAALGISTRELPGGRIRNPVHLLTTVRRLRRIVENEDPDLVLNWLSTAHLYGGPAAWLAGPRRPCAWWQLDMNGTSGVSRGRALDQIASVIPAHAVGACSAAAATAQAAYWPHRPAFSVLPGIPAPSFPAGAQPEALARRLGLPDDAVVVGSTGRLFAWKGHHRILKAVAELRREGINAHALIVGGGGHRGDRRYESSLRALTDEPTLRGHVTFTGQVADATPYMSLMDVFVNASEPEPFGLVVIEAMAAGLPVLAVAAGGPLEIVEQNRTGLLAPGGAIGQILPPLRRLVLDSAMRATLGEAGRRRYEERFTEVRMGAEMTERLLELAR